MEADVAFPFCPSPLSPCLRAARWKGQGLLLHAVPYRNHLRKYEPFPPLSCHSFLEPRRLLQSPATLTVTSARFGCDGLQRSPQAGFVFSRNGAVSPREIVTAGAAGPGAVIGVGRPRRGPTVARRWLLEPRLLVAALGSSPAGAEHPAVPCRLWGLVQGRSRGSWFVSGLCPFLFVLWFCCVWVGFFFVPKQQNARWVMCFVSFFNRE